MVAYLFWLLLVFGLVSSFVFEVSLPSNSLTSSPVTVTVTKKNGGSVVTDTDSYVKLVVYPSTTKLSGTLSMSIADGVASGTTTITFYEANTYYVKAVGNGYSSGTSSIIVSNAQAKYKFKFNQEPFPSPTSASQVCSGVSIGLYDEFDNNVIPSASFNFNLLAVPEASGNIGRMSNTVTISFSTISSAVTGFSCTVIGEGTFLLVTSNSEGVKNAVSSTFTVSQTLGSASITFFDPIIYVGETAKFKIALSDTISQSYIDTSSSCTATLSPSGTDTINIGYLDENSKIGSIVFNDISTKTLSITCTGDAGATSVTASATFKVYSRSGLIVSFPNIIKGTNNQVYQAKFGTRSNSALAPTSDITLAISTTTTAYLSLDTTSLNYLASAWDTYQGITFDVTDGLAGNYDIIFGHTATSSDSEFNGSKSYSSCLASGIATVKLYKSQETLVVDESLVMSFGSTGVISITVNFRPATTVTIAHTYTNSAQLTVTPASISFDSTSLYTKTFTVTSAGTQTTDVAYTDSIGYTITGDANFISDVKLVPNPLTTQVKIVQESYPSLKIKNSYLNLVNGGEGEYTVALGSKPQGPVTIAITSSVSSVKIKTGYASLSFTTTDYATAQIVKVIVDNDPSSLTDLYYTSTLTHTTTSTDANYNGLQYLTDVVIVNICEPAAYDWTSTSTCSVSISNFDVSSKIPVPCEIGKYYNSGTCTTCPIGEYCPNGRLKYTCPTGHYQTAPGQASCVKVPQGYIFSSASTSPTVVALGRFSLSGSITSNSCSLGDICPQTDLPHILKCGQTSYSGYADSTTCTTIDAGTYSKYSSTNNCPANTYSPFGYSTCQKCSYSAACGTFSRTVATEGSYVTSNTITTCTTDKICSVRFNYNPWTCPLNTKYSSGKCSLCSESNACLLSDANCASSLFDWGLLCIDQCVWPHIYDSGNCEPVSASKSYTSATTSTSCITGYFSPLGYPRCMLCSPGYKCTSGSGSPLDSIGTSTEVMSPGSPISTNKCPKGTYDTKTGIVSYSMCRPCPAGYKCDEELGIDPSSGSVCSGDGGSNTKCAKCGVGQFCPQGTKTDDNLVCPDGTYLVNTYPKTAAECTASVLGAYTQPTTSLGAILATNAGSGTYSNDLKSQTICPITYYTSSTLGTSLAACSTCSIKNVCFSYIGASSQSLCTLGFTTKSTKSICEICSSSNVCPGASWDSSTTIGCEAGYWCPAGSYSTKQYMCPAGFFGIASKTAQDDCSECTAGTYCASKSVSTTGAACSAGFWCPQGVHMANLFACYPGTFSATTSLSSPASCGPCTAGSACMTGSSAVASCAVGNFCPASTERPDQFACPIGTFTSSTSLVAASGCTACAAGYFCPSGSAKQFSCPPGTKRATGSAGDISECLDCAAGKYCPNANTVTETDCGAGYYCDAGATVRLECLPGYYCDGVNESSSTMYAKVCPGGKLCPRGTSIVPDASLNCVAGFYCPAGTLVPFPCPPGTYTTGGIAAKSDCTLMSAGTYFDSFGSTVDGTTCPAGYYCPIGTLKPIPCPFGTYNILIGKSASTDCLICTAGKYCPFEATTTLINCPTGNYCKAGSITPIKCPEGTFDNSAGAGGLNALTACTDCSAGKYCDQPGITAPTGDCKAGFFCVGKSITATPTDGTTGYICPAGSYCPAGTATIQACPNGSFNNYNGGKSSADCITCPKGFYCASTTAAEPTGPCSAGYFCLTGETSATPAAGIVAAGYYAPIGSYAQLPCEKGTYTSTTAKGSCDACPVGKYCPNNAMSSTTSCPAGYYCPLGTIDPIPCPPGTFRATIEATQLSDCTPCTAGKYCGTYGLTIESGNCDAGYFCELKSPYKTPSTLIDTPTEKYGPCPAGYFCPVGSILRSTNPCPAGTFGPSRLSMSLADCLPCSAGRFCTGTANVDDSSICPLEYFCPESSTSGTDNPCTAGNYCPAESKNQIKCEPGYYQNLGQKSSCNDCPIGHFCPRGTADYTPNTCPAGYYCLIKTIRQYQFPCAPGTYSTSTSATTSVTCVDCDAGKYCDTYGIGSVTSLNCAAGFYCSLAAIVSKPMDGSLYGGICKRGEFCPAGSSQSTTCTAGSYCSKDQLGAVIGQCSAGHYCTGGSKVPTPYSPTFSNGNICPQGNYCPLGSSTFTPCPSGKYLASTGASALADCLDCPAGFFCPNDGITTPTDECTAGFYCPGGDVSPTLKCDIGYYCPEGSHEPIPCPEGTYQDAAEQLDCKVCDAGFYCESGASSGTPCPAGYYCPTGTGYRFSYPCSVGTYNSGTGASTVASCAACDAGKYCETVGLSAPTGNCAGGWYCTASAVNDRPVKTGTGGICPRGTYCVAGSSSTSTCTAGSYCNRQGISLPIGTCHKGYWCSTGSTTWIPLNGSMGNKCAAGKYCAAGSSSETNCPAGTVSESKGLELSTECPTCSFGKYCATAGLTVVTGSCDAQYYCGGGATTQTQNGCIAGHYCIIGSFEPIPCDMGTYQTSSLQDSCDICTPGNYCDGDTSLPTPCPVGHYCPEGTRFDIEFPCEAGEYTDTIGESSCSDCPAGSVCDHGSFNTDTVCPIYSYCPENSGQPTICPLGYYNDDPGSTGLEAGTECTPCPPAYYCVDGRVSGVCEAGYLCVLGSPTPTPTGSNAYGYQCPSGRYCEKGTLVPTPCPDGLFRTLVGGRQESDCTQCPPGSYCVNGNPNPISCPMGYYCPQGINKPVPCPIRTYGSKAGAEDASACLACPGGYLCTRTGTADFNEYECDTIGYFCVVGATEPTPCPPGTYSDSTTAASIDDCVACPGGRQCPGSSDTVLPCLAGTYCPKRSPIALPCPIGHYCHTNTTIPDICPAGYYCPKYDQDNLDQYQDTTIGSPLSCPSTYVCPKGSFEPNQCKAGYYVVDNNCVACPSGTYSDGTFTRCKNCFGGYICESAAIRPNPVSSEYHGGYECPAGFYCPIGSKIPTACPMGTFNALLSQTSSESCLDCTVDTYADTTGNAKCKPCGSNAQSGIRSSDCTCKGANRAYQKTDGSCICKPNYQFIQDGLILKEDDSDIDCFDIVYDFCGEGFIRDSYGNCQINTDCSNECNGGSGTRLPGVGVCECDDVKTVDNLCNKACRQNALKATLTNGVAIVTDPETGEVTNVDIENSDGYYGKTSCPYASCKIYSIDMTETGPVGVYGIGTKLSAIYNVNSSRRRLQTSSSSIENPVICIQLFEAFVFTIPNSNNYPIYVKDSLLNTNNVFDYGAFQELERMITNPTNNITSFAFTFTEQGIYDFADNADSSKHIVISVMGDGQQCLDSDIPIRPRTKSSLLTLGTASKTSIIADPDWAFIGGTALWLVGVVCFAIAGLYFFNNKVWRYRIRKIKEEDYRQSQANIHLGELTQRPKTESSESENEEENVLNTQSNIKKPTKESKIPMINDDIDPSIFQAMFDRLVEQDAQAKTNFMQKSEAERETMHHLLNKLAKLKNYLQETLGSYSDVSDSEEEQIEMSPEQEMEKVMNGLMGKYINEAGYSTESSKKNLYESIVNNPELSQKDKQDLINDFNANIQRIELAIDSEKAKTQETLNKRLMERASKKRQKAKSSVTETPIAQVAENVEYVKNDPELAREFVERKKDLDIKSERELNTHIVQLKDELDKKLKNSKDKKEAESLVRKFDEAVKELESRVNSEKKHQESELAARLRARKDKKFKEKLSPPKIELESSPQPQMILVPTFFNEKDNEVVEVLEKKQEQELQILNDKQAQEQQAIEDEEEEIARQYEAQEETNRDEERVRLENALRSVSTQDERERLLKELEESQKASQGNAEVQHSQLDGRIQERRKLRALKEAELKKKHESERMEIISQQERESDNLRDDLTHQKLQELMSSNLNPEEMAKQIKDMMDDKHETELAALSAKKQGVLTQKQTKLLQKSLSKKAEEIADIRGSFVKKRKEIENSSLPMNKKVSELARLDKKEAESITLLDYNFIHDLNKEQDKLWREVEDDFRHKLLDLADKHLQDTLNILQRMRSANPALLEKHLKQAQNEANQLRNQAQNEYDAKLKELDIRQLQIKEMQGERENEISELQKELDNTEAKKRELAEMERMRKEMADRQKLMIEEMKRRGISKEDMEEMLKKHQQETSEWESAMEQERLRQREKMQEKMKLKAVKHQQLIAEQLAKYKEENLKIIQSKEEEKISIKYPTDKQLKLYEPMWDIQTKLRVYPLPVYKRNPVKTFADSSSILQTLLARVKRVEKLVENVDTKQFDGMMESLGQISSLIDKI